jgi:hypothetical protein
MDATSANRLEEIVLCSQSQKKFDLKMDLSSVWRIENIYREIISQRSISDAMKGVSRIILVF